MSPKYHSLALDDTLKGYSHNDLYNNFEPELKVIVSAFYTKNPKSIASHDVITVKGAITVSF